MMFSIMRDYFVKREYLDINQTAFENGELSGSMPHINFLDDQVRRVWTGLTTWTMSTGRRARQTGRILVLLASLG